MNYEDHEEADERAADEKLKEEILQSLFSDLEENEPDGAEIGSTEPPDSPVEPPAPAAATAVPGNPPVAPAAGPGALPGTPPAKPPLPEAVQGGSVPPPGKPPDEAPKRPLSPEKLSSNRANAQHSTGPKTPEGKAKSRFNAVKYGLTSRYFPTLLQQDCSWWQPYQDLRMNLYLHFSPEGPVEEMLVDKIVVEIIRYSRLLSKEQNPRVVENYTYWEILPLCSRYGSTVNKQIFQALKELERLQETRKEKQGQGGGNRTGRRRGMTS